MMAGLPIELVEQLNSMCSSSGFRRSPRLQRFLRYVVEQETSAPDKPLKETQIAVDVFDRRADFDSQFDPIVRVEAGRLRLRLTEYFAGPGQNDKIFIEIAKGGSLPSFRRHHQRRGKVDASGAYRLYLKGRHFWDKRTAESIAKAAEYYRQALAVDSGFTLAHSGIADCNFILATFEFAPPESLKDNGSGRQRMTDVDSVGLIGFVLHFGLLEVALRRERIPRFFVFPATPEVSALPRCILSS